LKGNYPLRVIVSIKQITPPNSPKRGGEWDGEKGMGGEGRGGEWRGERRGGEKKGGEGRGKEGAQDYTSPPKLISPYALGSVSSVSVFDYLYHFYAFYNLQSSLNHAHEL
jgi:hypothetical protein